jgi:Ca2+-binding RTX toxin-like protein
MKRYMSVVSRFGIAGLVVAVMVLGMMAGMATAAPAVGICDEPTVTCKFVKVAEDGTGVLKPGCPTINNDSNEQNWFCDFSNFTVGVVVGGDCPFVGTPTGPTDPLYDDIILGSEQDDTIDAGLGDDIVCAGGGDDVIDGGAGNDKLYGQAGNDVINGNDGNDSIVGSKDDDVLFGGNGNDSLNGGAGNDRCIGGDGSDSHLCEIISRSGSAGW